MAETSKAAIVRLPRRMYWRGHVTLYRNSGSFCFGLPTAQYWSRERREAWMEILAHRHLPT